MRVEQLPNLPGYEALRRDVASAVSREETYGSEDSQAALADMISVVVDAVGDDSGVKASDLPYANNHQETFRRTLAFNAARIVATGSQDTKDALIAVLEAAIEALGGSTEPVEPVAPVLVSAEITSNGLAVGNVASITNVVYDDPQPTPTPAVFGEWLRDDVPVSIGETYEFTEEDIGSTITCNVTATNSEGSDTILATGSLGPIVEFEESPPVIEAVTIGGDEGNLAGRIIGVTVDFTGYPEPTIDYTWYIDDVEYEDYNSQFFFLDESTIGYDITCKATATNAHGSDEMTSDPYGPIIEPEPEAPVMDSAEIEGVAAEGQTLNAYSVNANWPWPYSLTVTFQWYADNVEIPGATNNTFELTSNEVGAMIKCLVTVSNTEGSDSAETAEVGPVVAA